MEINSIGVVGAGIMGSGIAQVLAQAGYNVIIQDLEHWFVERGLAMIDKIISRAVEKNKLSREEAEALTGRVKGTTSLEDLGEAEMVIEAIVEDMDKKKELYLKLDRLAKPQAILASNTSGLSITEIASVTKRADRVIGMHFFNPAPVMKLVEVVRGVDTSDQTFNMIMDLACKLGKQPIAVNEAPLFVVNRILVPMINEAIFVLLEGTACAEDIDRGMVLGANHPIGPLALADLVGLDVVLMVLDNLFYETKDSKYRACPLLRKLVRAGRLGRKAGRGFYDY